MRAAASSTASGRSSSRRQSSAIVSSGSSRERSQKSSTASGAASGGTGYSTSPADPQQLPARDQEPQVGAGLEQLRELGRRLDHLLEVVEQQQELALGDVLGEAVLRPERLRDRLGHERGVAQRGQADPEDTRLERGHELGGDLQREPRLARAARTGERDEARAVPKQTRATPPARASCRRRRRRAAAGSCSRSSSAAGSAHCPSWKSATGSSKSFSAVLAELGQRRRRRAPASPPTATTWPPWPEAAIRAARCTSRPA